MSDGAATVYRGVWGVLERWFRVPRDPPTLPVASGEVVVSTRPSEGYLRYLKFWFWMALWPPDLAILVGWVALTVLMPPAGIVLALPALALAVLPDVVAYVVLHLKQDTTWYVLTERSVRIRRGVWSITETTISYENVQNVRLSQGPIQRWFGISDVIVETAGGGAPAPAEGGAASGGHLGVLVGIADAAALRDLVMARVRASRGAGLGDERSGATSGWTAAQVAVLKEIRAEIAGLGAGAGTQQDPA